MSYSTCWARANGHGLDFNPTCFSHPLAADGFSLAQRDPAIRQFWVEHCIASRRIGEYFGRALGTPAVTNIGIGSENTENVADKVASLLLFLDGLMLHVSRGVRWDSEHVVTFTYELQALAREIVCRDASAWTSCG